MMLQIIDPVTAIQKLRQYQKIVRPSPAISYLEDRLLSYRLMLIYQHFFPGEFAMSTASNYVPNLLEAKSHTPKEIELLNLIEDNLFPVNAWYHTNCFNQRMGSIPLTPTGIDWEAEDFDVWCLRPGWQALLPLCSGGRYWLESYGTEDIESTEETASWYESISGSRVALSDIAEPEKLNKNRFQKLCAASPYPLNLLPLVIAVLEHDTGNVFLDLYSYELGEDSPDTQLEWTIENIQFLTTAYQESEKIWDQANQVIDWLENDITTNFNQILKIWNRSSRRK